MASLRPPPLPGLVLATALICTAPGCLPPRDPGGGALDLWGSTDGSADALQGGDDSGTSDDLHRSTDLRSAADLGMAADLRSPPDLSMAGDMRMHADLSMPADMHAAPACHSGPGFAAFRFHYSAGGGTSATLDAFGLPDDSNWEAVPAFPTMIVDDIHGGGLGLGSGNWILIRFSLVGLTRIDSATLSVYGRSYDVSASGSFDAWSPLYGDISSPIDSISNAWPYTWTSVDYTANVHVGDDPGLTGMRLSAAGSSDSLAVHTVELCIDGS